MSMTSLKTADLIGPALDWAVAHATKAWESAHEMFPTMTLDPNFSGVAVRPYPRGEYGAMLKTCVLIPRNPMRQDPKAFCPSIDWSQGGPLIDKLRVSIIYSDEHCDPCAWTDDTGAWGGPTPLIAACRAIVAATFGPALQVPTELVTP